MNKNAMNKARALYYGVFSVFFSFLEKDEKIDDLQKSLKLLKENAINEHVSNAIDNIQSILENKGKITLKTESNEVFFNPYNSFIAMTASYYKEQRDDGKMRMKMLEYVLYSKFRRNEKEFKENEDHISFILEFMEKLLLDSVQNSNKCNEELAKTVFSEVLNIFVDDFIVSLYEHKNACIYKDVAVIFQVFIELERAYLDVAKPKKKAEATTVTIEKKVKKPLQKELKEILMR